MTMAWTVDEEGVDEEGAMEFDDAGNPTRISCGSAVREAAARTNVTVTITPLAVAYDYQAYWSAGLYDGLLASLPRTEGRLIEALAERVGLASEDGGAPDCAAFLYGGESWGGRSRRRRAPPRRRREAEAVLLDIESATILGVGAGEPDSPSYEHECIAFDDDLPGTSCTPMSGTLKIEMVGMNEAGVKSFVRSFTRLWMADQSNLDGVDGIDRLVFLGTRVPDPAVGKSGVGPALPSTGDAATPAEAAAPAGDDKPSDLGVTFAFFLCLALGLVLLLVGIRIVRKRRMRVVKEEKERPRDLDLKQDAGLDKDGKGVEVEDEEGDGNEVVTSRTENTSPTSEPLPCRMDEEGVGLEQAGELGHGERPVQQDKTLLAPRGSDPFPSNEKTEPAAPMSVGAISLSHSFPEPGGSTEGVEIFLNDDLGPYPSENSGKGPITSRTIFKTRRSVRQK